MSLTAQEIDLAKGLSIYYPFANSLSGPLSDASVALTQGTNWTRNRLGDEEAAIAFDGANDQIMVPVDGIPALSSATTYSLTLWIQPRDNNQGCILLKENDFGIKWNGLRKPLSVFDGWSGGIPEGKFRGWSSNDWYHIALVRTKDKLNLYINGELDNSWKASVKKDAEAKSLYIGKHPFMWGGFAGNIDDVAVYDRDLNQYEILMLSQVENIPLPDMVPKKISKPANLADFEGVWQGVITQPGNDLVPNYAFWLKFDRKEGDRLKGHSRIEVPENQAFGVTLVQGFVSGPAFNFEELKVIRQKNYKGYRWCKKFGQVVYDPKEDVLRGNWYANNCQQGGEFILYRTESPFNFHDNRLSTSISVEDLVAKLETRGKDNFLEENVLDLKLAPIQFPTSTSQLSPQSERYLQQELVPLLVSYPEIKLNLAGHTDNKGSDQLNLSLSVARAKAIYSFLVGKGIDPKRLSFQGFGESKPISSNDTEAGRRVNRRVEFQLNI